MFLESERSGFIIMLRVIEEAGGDPFNTPVKCVIGKQMLTVTQVLLKRTHCLWVIHLRNVIQWASFSCCDDEHHVYLAMVRSYEEKLVAAETLASARSGNCGDSDFTRLI